MALYLPPKAFAKLESQKAALDKLKAKGKEQIERATHSAIVGATGYALGYHKGRNGSGELAGKASASLVVALIGHTAALAGPAPYAPYAAAFGDGGVAALAVFAGVEAGEKARSQGKGPILKAG